VSPANFKLIAASIAGSDDERRQDTRDCARWWVPLILGVCAMSLVAGLGIVQTAQYRLLSADDDQGEAYIGWQFYRFAPPGNYPGSNSSMDLS